MADDWILLTNDDGVDSPALGPLIEHLSTIAPVHTVVPDSERSWIGKAMSRFDDVSVSTADVDGHPVHTCTGYPADCTQIGGHLLFDTGPALVVSGINIGANHGSSYLSASGTVGAAMEGAMMGLPAVAFSAVRHGDWETWSRHMASPASRPDWDRLARVATDITREVWTGGLPIAVDVLSVNMPSACDLDTERRVTRLAETRHGTLFAERDGQYHHRGSIGLHTIDPDPSDTDMAASEAGVISITPVRLAAMGDRRDDEVTARFTQSGLAPS